MVNWKQKLEDFVMLTEKMMDAQQAFFKGKRQEDLRVAKQLEKEVREQIHKTEMTLDVFEELIQ